MSIEATGKASSVNPQAIVNQSPQRQIAERDPEQTMVPDNESSTSMVERLESATNQLNDLMQGGRPSLAFAVDEKSEEMVIKVIDKSTSEVIRQIPTPEALELAQHIEGMIGVIFNRKI